jgi:hypothetical protein
MVIRLEKLWINKADDASNGDSAPLDQQESTSSSLSLGDTHIWRDNGDANV